jgi:quinol monooxygenase YgiN
MFIAILDFGTAAADRPAALAQLDAERLPVRAMPGCVNFRAFASAERDTDITVLHEWDDEMSFRAYLESEAFTRSGLVLRPLMSVPPISRRFHAELVESIA